MPEFLRQKPGPGSLTGDTDSLTPAERHFANEMRDLGNHVEVIPSSGVARSPDFRINGKLYELKTVSGVQRTDSDGLSAAVSNRILNARGQAGDIIVDARQQAGITREIGLRAIDRAYGLDNISKSSIQSITILTPGRAIHSPRRN